MGSWGEGALCRAKADVGIRMVSVGVVPGHLQRKWGYSFICGMRLQVSGCSCWGLPAGGGLRFTCVLVVCTIK